VLSTLPSKPARAANLFRRGALAPFPFGLRAYAARVDPEPKKARPRAENEDAEVVEAEVVEAPPPTRVARELVHGTPTAIVHAPSSGIVMYAAAAGLASIVPVPFLDGLLTGVARGSAVRRIAARRGVRLSHEARKTLAGVSMTRPTGTGTARLLRMALSRALSPIRIASRLEDATATVLSSLLLDHYLVTEERRIGSPLEDREARRIRTAMENAFAASGLESLKAVPLGALDIIVRAAKAALAIDAEDRGPVERFVDALLDAAADAPSDWLERLRVLFDEALAHERPS